MKRAFLLFLLFSLFFPYLVEAQATTPETIAAPALPTQSQADQGLPPIPSAPGGEPAGNVACFDYYRFGSVQADFESSLAQTVPGADIAFTGQVKNQNDYPLVNGTLYFKIFRRDEASFSQGDGNVLVDQFTLPDTFTLAAQGEKPFTFTWHVPELALGGEYYATAFFATEGRYNLLGLSFTDDVVGNQAQFSVTSDTPALAASFDRTSVTLNDQDHHFAAFPLHFAASDTVTAKMKLVNPTSESKVIRLTWKEYAWDALRPENQRNQEYELIELAPNESKELAYQFESKSDAVSYLVVEADDQGAKSLLDIRFVRDGIQETRINFPSILKYPLKPGEQNSLFACAHSTNEPVVPGNILTLALRDEQGNVLHTYKYEGDITGAMGGWKDDFTPASYLSNFTLTATLERENQVVEEVSIKYACNDIDPNLCEAKGGAAKEWLAGPKGTAILLIGLLTALALAAIAIVKMRGRKGIRRFGAILFMLTVASGFMAGGEVARAAPVPPSYTLTANPNTIQPGGSTTLSWNWILPQGVAFNFPGSYSSCQIDNGVGSLRGYPSGNGDSIVVPPGSLTVSPTQTTTYTLTCSGTYAYFGSVTPSQSYTSTSSVTVTVGQSNRPPNAPVIDGPVAGMRNTSYSFTATATDPDSDTINYGFDWNNDSLVDACAPTNCNSYVSSGTSQSLTRSWPTPGSYTFKVQTKDSKGANSGWTSHTITIADPIAPPAPDLRINNSDGPLTVAVGANLNLTWGLVANAVSCTGAGASWPGNKNPAGGSDNIQAIATTTYTLTCTGPGGTGTDSVVVNTVNAPAPDLRINNSDGPLTVAVGANLNLTWGLVANAVSCTGAGASWPGNKNPAGGNDTLQATTTTTYTLTCTGPGGTGSDSVVVNTVGAPVVDLKVNGSDGPLTVAMGSNLNIRYNAISNAISCTGAGAGWPGNKSPAGGNDTLQATATTTYTLTCTNSVGISGTDSVTVNVLSAPIPDLKVNASDGPLTVNQGTNLNLTWGLVANAVSCTGAGASWPGNKSPAGGSDNIQAIATTTYTLTCTNSVGVSGTDSVSVTVLPPIPGQCGAAANFPTRFPPTIGLCNVGNPSAVIPALEPGPYTWTCSGTNGGVPAACTAPYLEPAPIVDLKVNGSDGPLTVTYGSNLNITWPSIPYAANCTGSGGSWGGAKSVSGGNDNVTATAPASYRLTCVNSQGVTGGDTVSVNIQNTLKLCQGTTCNSGVVLPDPSFTMIRGETRNAVACWNPNPACGDASGNVTSSTDWAEQGSNNAVSLTPVGSTRRINADNVGTERIKASYPSAPISLFRDITVTCTPRSCESDTRYRDYCSDQPFSLDTGCGYERICNGSRSCDFNWREVAPE